MAWYHRTEFLGHDLALFLPEPNWKWSVELVHRLEVETHEGNTGRENREPTHEALRLEMLATFTLSGAVATELESALWNLGTAFVGMPIFPDVRTPGHWAERIYDAEFVINYDETGYAIYAKAEVPAEPLRAWLAPLLVGRLQSKPRKTVLTEDTAQLPIRLLERSPWDFVTAPRALAVGADWPAELVPNVRELPEEWIEQTLEYRDLGKGRPEAVEGEEKAVRRAQRFLLTLGTITEIRTLLNFFKARGGARQAFTVPWVFKPGADSAETPHETKARFAEDALSLEFVHGALARVWITVVQLPWEQEALAGETPAQPARAYLYKLAQDVPGGPLVWRFTDWERLITRAGDGDYSPALIEHDQTSGTIDLSDEPVKLTTWIGADNPLTGFLQRRIDVPMTVEIYECDPATPNAAELVYSGKIGQVGSKGRQIDAKTIVLGGVLDAKVPNFYFGPICNYEFCGAGCGLDPEDWTFSGTVQSQAGNVLTVLVTDNPPAAALVDDYFAGAWVKKGLGAEYEVRKIIRSEDLGGGVQQFTLKRAFLDVDVAAAVTFRPYCTGTRGECEDKFDNYPNFGGHPHIGARNISLPKMNTATSAAKK